MPTINGNFSAGAFSILCLALAMWHRMDQKLDTTSIGLMIAASLPWLIPLLAPFLTSLKVAGLEMQFREIKKQVEENKQVAQAAVSAAVSGVGRAPAAAPVESRRYHEFDEEPLSHGVPVPGRLLEEEDAGGEGDPNKGAFGGSPERGGWKLQAEVKTVPGVTDYFLVHAWVGSVDGSRPLPDGTEVTFYLHPTFAQSVVRAVATGGVASVDKLAWGAFTIGAEVEGVKLELDLAELPGAPELFRRR